MGVQIAEMAGGLLQLVIAGLILWAVAEISCRIFFWIRERGQE
jgi:hypothetical protein